MADNENVLEIDLKKNGGEISFKTDDDINNFIQKEFNFWGWIHQSPVSGQMPGNQPANFIQNKFQALNQAVQHFRSNKDYCNGVLSAFEEYFVNSKIPISTGNVAIFIMELHARLGPHVAASALASYTNQLTQIGQSSHLRGAMEMQAFEMGINNNSAISIQNSLSQLHEQFSKSRVGVEKQGNSLFKSLEKQSLTQADSFKQSSDYVKKLSKTMQRWSSHRIKMYVRRKDEEFAKSVEEFKAVELLYKEHMKIKSPVDYWTSKASTHRTDAIKRRNSLVCYAVISGLFVVGGLVLAAIYADRFIKTDTPIAILGLWGAIGLLSTTVALWVGRIMVRLYLSEHHLAIDANERATMAMTYLALTAEGKADEKDRNTVLTALFRPSSDGIVKDDAAPELGLAGILSKVAAK